MLFSQTKRGPAVGQRSSRLVSTDVLSMRGPRKRGQSSANAGQMHTRATIPIMKEGLGELNKWIMVMGLAKKLDSERFAQDCKALGHTSVRRFFAFKFHRHVAVVINIGKYFRHSPIIQV